MPAGDTGSVAIVAAVDQRLAVAAMPDARADTPLWQVRHMRQQFAFDGFGSEHLSVSTRHDEVTFGSETSRSAAWQIWDDLSETDDLRDELAWADWIQPARG